MKYIYNIEKNVAVQEFEFVPTFEVWEYTEEIGQQLEGKIFPQIIDGVVVETATQEEIQNFLLGAIPLEVALWKLRFILSQMGLEEAVQNVINELPEPQKTAANYIWTYGTAVDRDSNTVLLIKTALGLTEYQLNQIFIQANQIQL